MIPSLQNKEPALTTRNKFQSSAQQNKSGIKNVPNKTNKFGAKEPHISTPKTKGKIIKFSPN